MKQSDHKDARCSMQEILYSASRSAESLRDVHVHDSQALENAKDVRREETSQTECKSEKEGR